MIYWCANPIERTFTTHILRAAAQWSLADDRSHSLTRRARGRLPREQSASPPAGRVHRPGQGQGEPAILLEAAKPRGEALDHVLLYGPPGLGKTTLSLIIAAEMGVGIRMTSGPAIERAGDLASILTALKSAMSSSSTRSTASARPVEEVLYSAMEDFALDIIIGKGPSARTMRLKLPPFTSSARRRASALLTAAVARPLRRDLPAGFLRRAAMLSTSCAARHASSSVTMDEDGARRSRGARAARRASPTGCCAACATTPRCAPDGVDRRARSRVRPGAAGDRRARPGRDRPPRPADDHREVRWRPGRHRDAGGGDERRGRHDQDVYEPYLIQLGFLQRTPRGRVATRRAYEHLGIPYRGDPGTLGLWDLPPDEGL